MSDDVLSKLDQILEQARRTNGRVTALEQDMGDVTHTVDDFKQVLYGDKNRQTPGLVAQARDTETLLRQWRTLTKVMRWAAGAFGAAAVGLLANLAGSGFGG